MRRKLGYGICEPSLTRVIKRPQRFDHIQAANKRVFRRPPSPFGEHALAKTSHQAGRVYDDLHFSLRRANVFGMAKVSRHPVEMPAPFSAVAVILVEQRALGLGGAIPPDGPGLVGPGEHEWGVGLPVGEHSLENSVHDWVAEPIVVVDQAVQAEVEEVSFIIQGFKEKGTSTNPESRASFP